MRYSNLGDQYRALSKGQYITEGRVLTRNESIVFITG